MANNDTASESNQDLNKLNKWISRVMKEGGREAVLKFAEKRRTDWKNVRVNVGVIGRTGVGKSTFINSYRGIESGEDEGGAPVGVTETTKKATRYIDPKNTNISLWDVPGVGTKQFSRDKYLRNPNVGIENYDFVIIITANRYCEDDEWLYKKMDEMRKPVFWAKTKVMDDVRNEKRQKRREFKGKTEKEIIEALKIKYKSEMKTSKKVYFIDSHEPDHPNLDFGELLADIVKNVPKAIAEAVLFSLRVFAPELIDEKVKQLKDRAGYVAFLSAAGATIPIPGVSAVLDGALITKETMFYREQLGLEEGSSGKYLKGPSASKIFKAWKTISQSLIQSYVFSEVAENATKFVIPFIGSIIAGGLSYGTTVHTLNTILDAMAVDAKKLNELIIQEFRENEADRTG